MVGVLWPKVGEALKPVADGFIRLVKMVVGPVVFLTIVVGIAGMGDLKRVGRVGIKALVYFEVVTTAALAIGLVVANVVRPGAGVGKAGAGAAADVAIYTRQAEGHSFTEFLLNVIPDNVLGAFVRGDLVQILFISVLFGAAVATLGARGRPVVDACERLTEVMFRIVGIIMRVAPLGALGAMAYTVGKYGAGTLWPLMKLMVCVYLT